MARKRSIVPVVVLWLVAIGLFVVLFFLYHDTRLSHRSGGFPHMPLYGAVVWWFFLTIPIIGFTWGYFNDLRDDGTHLDQAARREREE